MGRTTALLMCEGSVTMNSDDAFLRDDNGHALVHVHHEIAIAHLTALNTVKLLHKPDVERIVPWCDVCGVAAPCPTLEVVDAALTTEAR